MDVFVVFATQQHHVLWTFVGHPATIWALMHVVVGHVMQVQRVVLALCPPAHLAHSHALGLLDRLEI